MKRTWFKAKSISCQAYTFASTTPTFVISPCAAVCIFGNNDACNACIMCTVVDMETAEWRGVVNRHRGRFIDDELLVESTRVDFVTRRG